MAAGARASEPAGKQRGPHPKVEARKKSKKAPASYRARARNSTRPEGSAGSNTTRKRSTRQVAGQQRSELLRLALLRKRHGIVLEPRPWVFALAALRACREGGRCFFRGREIPDPGLDMMTLRDDVRVCSPVLEASDELLENVIANVTAHNKKIGSARPFTPKKLGALVGLSRDEREEGKIRLIEAVDEPRAKRSVRKAEERRARDRARKEAKRREQKKMKRDEWRAKCGANRKEPWKAYGLSKPTFYRYKKAGKLPPLAA